MQQNISNIHKKHAVLRICIVHKNRRFYFRFMIIDFFLVINDNGYINVSNFTLQTLQTIHPDFSLGGNQEQEENK